MPKLTPGQRERMLADAAQRIDPGYAAAMTILEDGFGAVDYGTTVWPFVKPLSRTVRWDDILDGADWPMDERVLLEVARALYCGHGTVTFWEVVDMLDDDQFALVMRAVAIRRGSVEPAIIV